VSFTLLDKERNNNKNDCQTYFFSLSLWIVFFETGSIIFLKIISRRFFLLLFWKKVGKVKDYFFWCFFPLFQNFTNNKQVKVLLRNNCFIEKKVVKIILA
jgi:hypothetical protein